MSLRLFKSRDAAERSCKALVANSIADCKDKHDNSQKRKISSSAWQHEKEQDADLSRREPRCSSDVHEAAKQMHALGGLGDLPVGTPGTPTQPNCPLQAITRVCTGYAPPDHT